MPTSCVCHGYNQHSETFYKCATSQENLSSGLRPGKTQTGLLSYTDQLESLKFYLASIGIILSKQRKQRC